MNFENNFNHCDEDFKSEKCCPKIIFVIPTGPTGGTGGIGPTGPTGATGATHPVKSVKYLIF